LNAALTEVSEPFAGLVLTFDARHGLFSVVLSGKSRTMIASGVRLTPRSGLAPQPVRAGYGAVSCYSVNWWRSAHRLPPFCFDRSALRPQSGSYLLPKSFLLALRLPRKA
jgi:hypothetical protein